MKGDIVAIIASAPQFQKGFGARRSSNASTKPHDNNNSAARASSANSADCGNHEFHAPRVAYATHATHAADPSAHSAGTSHAAHTVHVPTNANHSYRATNFNANNHANCNVERHTNFNAHFNGNPATGNEPNTNNLQHAQNAQHLPTLPTLQNVLSASCLNQSDHHWNQTGQLFNEWNELDGMDIFDLIHHQKWQTLLKLLSTPHPTHHRTNNDNNPNLAQVQSRDGSYPLHYVCLQLAQITRRNNGFRRRPSAQLSRSGRGGQIRCHCNEYTSRRNNVECKCRRSHPSGPCTRRHSTCSDDPLQSNSVRPVHAIIGGAATSPDESNAAEKVELFHATDVAGIVEVIHALLQLYPKAASCRNSLGMLPLHCLFCTDTHDNRNNDGENSDFRDCSDFSDCSDIHGNENRSGSSALDSFRSSGKCCGGEDEPRSNNQGVQSAATALRPTQHESSPKSYNQRRPFFSLRQPRHVQSFPCQQLNRPKRIKHLSHQRHCHKEQATCPSNLSPSLDQSTLSTPPLMHGQFHTMHPSQASHTPHTSISLDAMIRTSSSRVEIDPFNTSNPTNTPWKASLSGQLLQIVQLLLKTHAAAAHALDFFGQLPLHRACRSSITPETHEIIQCLIEAFPQGASVADHKGKFPLHYICEGLANVANNESSSRNHGGDATAVTDGSVCDNAGNGRNDDNHASEGINSSRMSERVADKNKILVMEKVLRFVFDAHPCAAIQRDNMGQFPDLNCLDLWNNSGQLDQTNNLSDRPSNSLDQLSCLGQRRNSCLCDATSTTSTTASLTTASSTSPTSIAISSSTSSTSSTSSIMSITTSPQEESHQTQQMAPSSLASLETENAQLKQQLAESYQNAKHEQQMRKEAEEKLEKLSMSHQFLILIRKNQMQEMEQLQTSLEEVMTQNVVLQQQHQQCAFLKEEKLDGKMSDQLQESLSQAQVEIQSLKARNNKLSSDNDGLRLHVRELTTVVGEARREIRKLNQVRQSQQSCRARTQAEENKGDGTSAQYVEEGTPERVERLEGELSRARMVIGAFSIENGKLKEECARLKQSRCLCKKHAERNGQQQQNEPFFLKAECRDDANGRHKEIEEPLEEYKGYSASPVADDSGDGRRKMPNQENASDACNESTREGQQHRYGYRWKKDQTDIHEGPSRTTVGIGSDYATSNIHSNHRTQNSNISCGRSHEETDNPGRENLAAKLNALNSVLNQFQDKHYISRSKRKRTRIDFLSNGQSGQGEGVSEKTNGIGGGGVLDERDEIGSVNKGNRVNYNEASNGSSSPDNAIERKTIFRSNHTKPPLIFNRLEPPCNKAPAGRMLKDQLENREDISSKRQKLE